jgi:hypothetical protein
MKRYLVSMLAVVLGFSLASTTCLAGGKGGKGQKGNRGAKAAQRFERADARVSARISKIEQRVAAHPNAPAAVKDAANKLVASLKTLQSDVEKAKTAIAARDKLTVTRLKATLKSDHAAVKADHKAFFAAVHAAVQDLRGIRGHAKKNGQKAVTA